MAPATKRSFYQDDVSVVTKPGYNSEIPASLAEKESSHGSITFVDGMGIRSTPYLERHLNHLRGILHDKLSICTAEIGTQLTALSCETRTFAHHVQDTVKEPLLPSTIYILTASLATSVFASKRLWPVRFAAPLAAGVASTAYFMPRTYEAVKVKYNAIEQEYLPRLHKQKQDLIVSTYDYVKREFDSISAQTHQSIFDAVHQTRETLQLLWDTE